MKEEKIENEQLSVQIDDLITRYVKQRKDHKKYIRNHAHPSEERLLIFKQNNEALETEIKELAKNNRNLFDNKIRQKTVVLALNEYLCIFY